jgi:hypothetical protein
MFDDVRSAVNDNSREIKQNLTYSCVSKKRLIISSDDLQSDRTAEKGTLGSEAAVLENVHLEHLSTALLVNHLTREIIAQHSPTPAAALAGCGRVGGVQTASAANHILQQASMASIFGRSWNQPPASRTQF